MQDTLLKFKKGTQYVQIIHPVTSKELTQLDDLNEDYLNLNLVKFIPASGAATRMFQPLYTYLDTKEPNPYIETFFKALKSFPFYKDLAKSLNQPKRDNLEHIIHNLLYTPMKYGQLPKALLKVHQYVDQALTPIDEHIVEGEHYLNKDNVKLHFTISLEHEALFKEHIKNSLNDKPHIKITYSFQKPTTDTLAVTLNNEPFLFENTPLYRPGGHGALIENLNDLDADIIFIKNIDNVCHQAHIKDTIKSKKRLASIGLKVKQELDHYIKDLHANNYDLDKIKSFIRNTLNIHPKNALTKETALRFLNRPLRVCGVVKNTGEPGGGPFIVDNGDYTDLQICEMSEIDLSKDSTKELLAKSEYFNPVDLVCFVKDYKNEKYNLLDYINHDRYFISQKSYKGRPLKALEHPGLWNGAMHYWNTLFVEVPLATFNPIKTVNDLLRPGHQPDKN